MNKEELKELAATLNGIADGKAWEFQGLQENWYVGNLAGHNPQRLAADGWKIRLKPWLLPPPPEGQQWHRDDWTEEMLPEGWRPLLEGESSQNGDQRSLCGIDWEYFGEGAAPFNVPSASNEHMLLRTKRPLPQPDPYAELKAAHAAGKVIQHNRGNGSYPNWCDVPDPEFSDRVSTYRIKPEQQKVPFQPSDVLPFCVFRFKGFNDLLTPFCVKDERVYFFSDTSHCWGYEWLMRNAEINRSIPLTGKWNPEAWEFCYKLIDTP